jgi:hypothetical protein
VGFYMIRCGRLEQHTPVGMSATALVLWGTENRPRAGSPLGSDSGPLCHLACSDRPNSCASAPGHLGPH